MLEFNAKHVCLSLEVSEVVIIDTIAFYAIQKYWHLKILFLIRDYLILILIEFVILMSKTSI